MTYSPPQKNSILLSAGQIIRSKRKTLALIVKPDGSLLIRAPMHTPRAVIEEFVRKNTQWIESKQAEAFSALPAPVRQFAPGETCLYLGTTYPVEIVGEPREPLSLDSGRFKLSASHQHEAAFLFERWYRVQASEILTAHVELFSRKYGFQYKGIRITSARTRWGSCSSTGSLSFSWRLIQAPLVVVDYVIVHELVHTVFHNHSKRFWRKVEEILPGYREQRKWLKEHGRKLLM